MGRLRVVDRERKVAGNTIDFNPAEIAHCNKAAWPDCGAGGIFAE